MGRGDPVVRRRRRRKIYLKSNKIVNITLANSLLHRLHTQYVQQNIQYLQQNIRMKRQERATDNRVIAGSNPAEAVWKLWQFPLPHFASVFRKRH